MGYHFDFSTVLSQGWQALLDGTLETLRISVISCAIGLVLGCAVMLARRSHWRIVAVSAGGFIEVIRNTPFLVQIFFLYFGLPALGMRMGVAPASILALSLNAAAFIAEILRGGVESIPPGQIEAGRALGLKPYQIYKDIVFRSALRAVYPSLTSQFILLLLGSSVTASISAQDLMSMAQILESQTFRSFEVYLVVAAIYLFLSQIFTLLFWLLKRYYLSYPVK